MKEITVIGLTKAGGDDFKCGDVTLSGRMSIVIATVAYAMALKVRHKKLPKRSKATRILDVILEEYSEDFVLDEKNFLVCRTPDKFAIMLSNPSLIFTPGHSGRMQITVSGRCFFGRCFFVNGPLNYDPGCVIETPYGVYFVKEPVDDHFFLGVFKQPNPEKILSETQRLSRIRSGYEIKTRKDAAGNIKAVQGVVRDSVNTWNRAGIDA